MLGTFSSVPLRKPVQSSAYPRSRKPSLRPCRSAGGPYAALEAWLSRRRDGKTGIRIESAGVQDGLGGLFDSGLLRVRRSRTRKIIVNNSI